MTSTTIRRLAAIALFAVVVAACGGSTSGAADADVVTPAAPVVNDDVAANAPVDPNDPEDVGAVIYEDGEPVPGTTLNACELVTAADVQSAFAAPDPVAPGLFEADPTTLSPGHSECTYEGSFGRVIVSLTPEDGANLYDAAYGAYDGLEPITGLGDGAFWSDKNHRGFVWQDKVTTVFTIYPNGQTLTGLDLTQSLGSAMVDKL